MMQRSSVYGRSAVASSQPLASAAGAEVLFRGGNAADAGIAVGAALAVTEPCANGLGGDLLGLYHCARTRQTTAILGNGAAPSALTSELYSSDCGPCSPHVVTVPGAVAAWTDISETFGRVPLKEALRPAIKLARDGFPVGPITASDWARCAAVFADKDAREALMMKDGSKWRTPRVGELFFCKDLANILMEVSVSGKDAFYKGKVAKNIVEAVNSRGGVMEMSDLESHYTRFEKPISTLYRNVTVHEVGPPTHGAVAIIAMNILEEIEVDSMQQGGGELLHYMVEAIRAAYAEVGAYLGDPNFKGDRTKELIGKKFANELRKNIGQKRGVVKKGGSLKAEGTVQFCVVDAEGNAFSAVQSNYTGFGTGIVPKGCGFSLHNRGLGFVTESGHANCVAGGKRPYHTIIPGLMTCLDGGLRGTFGVMSSYMQPQGHLQVLSNIVDFGDDPQTALDRPRFRATGPFSAVEGQDEEQVLVECTMKQESVQELVNRGHDVYVCGENFHLPFGRGQVILREENGIVAAGSDFRADGVAIALPDFSEEKDKE